MKGKRKKKQISKPRNNKRNITTDNTEIQNTPRIYQENLLFNKWEHLEKYYED